MPVYGRKCGSCEWETDFALEKWQEREKPCPACAQPTARIWTGAPAIIPDTFTTPLVDDVMGKTRQVFHSRSERRAAMAKHGVSEMIRHVGEPGSDRSRHTSRWL